MTVAEVLLWGTRVGYAVFDPERGLGSFEYEKDFLRSGIQIAPLMMPLSDRVYSFPELNRSSFHGLPGLLADSLPDKFGNAVIDAWLASQGRSPESFDPVERLCYTGSRGMGALEFVPALGPVSSASDPVRVGALVELASKILRERESLHVDESDHAMQDILRIGSSAGGARAKAVIAWNPVSGDIRSGQIEAGSGYEYWLIKFDGVSGNGDKEGSDGEQYTRIEYAYSLMAGAAGIDMSECRIYREGGRHHFMTRRFDRDPLTGDKLHMQTLGGIAHYDFNLPGCCSYEQAAAVMRRLGLSTAEVGQFYRRMVFNVLANNRDDHVKNISFLMDRRGRWHLSPAYDVTYAYNPDGMWTGRHQMAVNGKRDRIDRNDLLACAENMGIKKSAALDAIEAVRQSLRCWPEFAQAAALKESLAEEVQRNLETI